MPKVAVTPDFPASLRAILESWGFGFSESSPEVVLYAVANGIEIRIPGSAHLFDKIFFPLDGKADEFRWRIETVIERPQRLAKRLHDLRSPLNAIQGYAEMIAETADGDTLRFASNIRTASEALTERLESFREEGV